MTKKDILLIIGTVLCFIAVVVLSTFSCKSAQSIKQQIASELEVSESDISLFDTHTIGEYQISGVRYGSNQYGLVWMLSKKDGTELVWIKTSDKMARRADNVWVMAMAFKEKSFYVFLSANEDFSSIVWADQDGVKTYYIDHTPSLKIVFHNIGSNSYSLLDKNGGILQ